MIKPLHNLSSIQFNAHCMLQMTEGRSSQATLLSATEKTCEIAFRLGLRLGNYRSVFTFLLVFACKEALSSKSCFALRRYPASSLQKSSDTFETYVTPPSYTVGQICATLLSLYCHIILKVCVYSCQNTASDLLG